MGPERVAKIVWFGLATIVVFVVLCPTVLAQCAMCKASAAAASGNAAKSLNLAVLVLLTPPVVMFCAFVAVAYKHRKAPDEKAEMINDE